jgi:hypothetical protein
VPISATWNDGVGPRAREVFFAPNLPERLWRHCLYFQKYTCPRFRSSFMSAMESVPGMPGLNPLLGFTRPSPIIPPPPPTGSASGRVADHCRESRWLLPPVTRTTMKTRSEMSVLIAIIGAISAIAAAVAAPICSKLLSSDSPQPAAAATSTSRVAAESPVAPGIPIEGTWKQWVYDETGTPVEIGAFVVTRQRGEYVISARRQNESERIMNSLGIFDVQYDGSLWTFNSNWGKGEVGSFHLQRQADTVFEGEIRVAGQIPNRTKWVKIE